MIEMLTDDQVKANIAANLQRLLEERDLTRTELANRTGDPLMTISVTCAGKTMPGSGLLMRIAEALDVSIDRLTAPPPEFSRRAS